MPLPVPFLHATHVLYQPLIMPPPKASLSKVRISEQSQQEHFLPCANRIQEGPLSFAWSQPGRFLSLPIAAGGFMVAASSPQHAPFRFAARLVVFWWDPKERHGGILRNDASLSDSFQLSLTALEKGSCLARSRRGGSGSAHTTQTCEVVLLPLKQMRVQLPFKEDNVSLNCVQAPLLLQCLESIPACLSFQCKAGSAIFSG